MMRRVRGWMLVLVMLPVCGGWTIWAQPSQKLEVSLATDKLMDVAPDYDGRARITMVKYVEPRDRTLVIKHQPTIFYVIIRNNTKTARKLYGGQAGVYAYISFEVTDEKTGKKMILKHKPRQVRSAQRPARYLEPGDQRVFDIFIDPNDWENTIQIEPGKVKTYKVRVMVDNKETTLYSEPYRVILDGTGLKAYPEPPKRDDTRKSVG